MSIKTTNIPSLRSREVLVKVFATAINRADTLQVDYFELITSTTDYSRYKFGLDICRIVTKKKLSQ